MTTALAFFSAAIRKKWCPSKRGPCKAKKTSPGRMVRVSMETLFTVVVGYPEMSEPFVALRRSCTVKVMRRKLRCDGQPRDRQKEWFGPSEFGSFRALSPQ